MSNKFFKNKNRLLTLIAFGSLYVLIIFKDGVGTTIAKLIFSLSFTLLLWFLSISFKRNEKIFDYINDLYEYIIENEDLKVKKSKNEKREIIF